MADWVLNIGVPSGYARTDLCEHSREVAAELALPGEGPAMFTAVDLRRWRRWDFEGVGVDATVGISHPTWAAASPLTEPAPGPGTINLVVQVPVGLAQAAAVNAVMTATEAKAQALAALGVPGTGTPTDAITVVWPPGAVEERFAGPRSRWGSRIAHAVHGAVSAGARWRW